MAEQSWKCEGCKETKTAEAEDVEYRLRIQARGPFRKTTIFGGPVVATGYPSLGMSLCNPCILSLLRTLMTICKGGEASEKVLAMWQPLPDTHQAAE